MSHKPVICLGCFKEGLQEDGAQSSCRLDVFLLSPEEHQQRENTTEHAGQRAASQSHVGKTQRVRVHTDR